MTTPPSAHPGEDANLHRLDDQEPNWKARALASGTGEPFERYPALASWIERLANTELGLSLGDWMVFLGAVNATIVQIEARALAAEREDRDPTDGLPGILIDLCRGWADGLPVNGGDIEKVTDASHALRRAEAQSLLLAGQVERLSGALEPFAKYAESMSDKVSGGHTICGRDTPAGLVQVKIKDFREARTVLASLTNKQGA